MVHVSCDLCGKELTLGDVTRHVVRIEVYAAQDPATITEEDLDYDHMEAVSEILRDMDDQAGVSPEPAHRHFRYDLCSECREKFVRDPLGREAQKFDFSEN